MADKDQTEFATELANLIVAALEAEIDPEEIIAALTEQLEEMEARANGEDEPPDDENHP